MTNKEKEDILNIIDSVFGADPAYCYYASHDQFEIKVAKALLFIKEVILNEEATK